MDVELTRMFGISVLDGALEPEWTNSEPAKPVHNPEQIIMSNTMHYYGICDPRGNT